MTQKVLVVDDEVDFQNLISAKFRKSIKNKDIQFCFALNGSIALKILENDPEINIILTDIKMPVMDGLVLLSNLPKLNRPYKAIVVSAYGDISNIRAAMNLGASDFIFKPIDFEDLEITLNKIIAEYYTLTAALVAKSKLNELEVELNIAKTIQEDMIPSNFQPLPNCDLDIAGSMIPAKIVGGDYFDFFPLNEHKIAIVIADVSGKSIPACLYMIITKSLFRAFSNEKISCGEVVNMTNKFLYKNNSCCFFVTAFYAILDVSNGNFVYCNAGHPPPYLIKKEGSIQKIASLGGPALGLDTTFFKSPVIYQESSLTLKNEDCLFLYTDGVTEAWNATNHQYSKQHVEKTLKLCAGKPAVKVIDSITNTLKSFTNNLIQSDDITMLAIRCKQK